MQSLSKKSYTHGLGYFSHLKFTIILSFKFFCVSIGCLVHSFVPRAFSCFPNRLGREAYEKLLLEGTHVNVDKLILQNIILKKMIKETSSKYFNESKILKEIETYEFD